MNFDLPPGGIVGVIGPNGAGKTTLFRLIMWDEKPDGGSLDQGQTVQLAYVDQSRDALDPDKTVFEEITDGEVDLKFGKRTEDMKKQSSLWCRCINALAKRPKLSAGFFYLLNDINEISKRSGKPVVLRHYNHITLTEMPQHLLELQTLS